MCAHPAPLGFSLPSDLADVCLSDVHTMASNSPFPAAFRVIWSIARSSSAAASSDAVYLSPAQEVFTKNDLVSANRRHPEQYAVSGKLAAWDERKLNVPRCFSILGPAQRIRLRKSSAIAPRVVERYKDATDANLTNLAKWALLGMASAFR